MKQKSYDQIKRTTTFVLAVFAVIFALTALMGTEQPEPPTAVKAVTP